MRVVDCKCGNVVGVIKRIEGKDLLSVNGVLVRSLHGTCECGEEFHYSTGDRLMAELVEKVIEMREDSMK